MLDISEVSLSQVVSKPEVCRKVILLYKVGVQAFCFHSTLITEGPCYEASGELVEHEGEILPRPGFFLLCKGKCPK